MAFLQRRLFLFSRVKKTVASLELPDIGQPMAESNRVLVSRLLSQSKRSVRHRPEIIFSPLCQPTSCYACRPSDQCYGHQPVRTFFQVSQENHVHSPWPPVEIPYISMGEFLMAKLDKYGSLEAMVDLPTRRRWTFQELRDDVIRVTSGLINLGIGKGDVVCVFAGNCPEYVILLVALMNVGAVLSPVNPASTAAELSRALTLARPCAVVADFALTGTADQACAGENSIKIKISVGSADGWCPFSQLLEDGGLSFTKPVDVNPKEDLALLPFSSGTTGLPKGVMLTHYNVLSNMLQFRQATPAIAGHDRVLAYLPFFHAYGLNGKILYCLNNGVSLNITPKFTDKLIHILAEERITILHLVPPICIYMVKHPNLKHFDLSSVRWTLCAAAPVGKPQIDLFIESTGIQEFIQGYGMTELAPMATMDSHPVQVGSVGKPVSRTTMKVIDLETRETLRAGQTGEICIRGPQVMAGYLGNKEATSATIQDDWLNSGDVGHYDSGGYFYVTDRVKELIKYKANQVAPAELEALLVTHPAIQDAAVIGVTDDDAGELPRAYIVTKAGVSTDFTPNDVINFISDQVAPHKKLRGGAEFVSEIPKSPSGKILRRVLKDKLR